MRNVFGKLALLERFICAPFALTVPTIKLLAIVISAVVLAATPTILKAQDSSSMVGTVKDATGAVIPGATVVLSNALTGVSYTQASDKTGSYRFPDVPPNSGYTATFTAPNFATVKLDNITLSVGMTRTQDAKLVAGSNEVVEISASSQNVTLNTTDATIGNNIDVKSLNQLPIQDRTNGVSTLFNFQPGVDNMQLGGTGSVTGARTDQTEVTIDGLDVNDIAAGTAFGIVGTAPVDSVDQFTGTVAGMVPSVGTGSGGQFQLVTKAGTNHFHGNINEYHRDTTTASNTYFNNGVGVPRTPLIRNQFGGNIGGPIIKDKLFFFVDIADSRIIQSQTTEPIVPLANLESATPTLNYINNGAGCSASSSLSTSPTCISSLTATQVAALDPAGIGFDPSVMSFIKGRYPVANDPTHGDDVNTGGLRFTSPAPDIDTTYVGRVDYNLTSTQKIYGRFTLNRRNAVYTATTAGAPQYPSDPDGLTETDRSYGYVISHIWTIGQNKVNQFYYGDNISKYDFITGDFPTSPNVYTFSGLSNPYGTYNLQERRVPIPVVRDDFNWQVRSHSLDMGGDFKWIKTNSNALGDFNFVAAGLQGVAISNGLDSSMRPTTINSSPTAQVTDYDSLFATTLGLIGDISTNFNYTAAGTAVPAGTGGPRAYRYYETEAYVGDTWKVTKNLTLTYGLRWQFDSVPYEAHGAESISELVGSTPHASTFNAYFNQRLAQNESGVYGNTTLPLFQEVLGGKANNAPSSYMPSYKDFAPRVAFAYNPWPKTIFNGSAAIVYDRTIINAINFLQDQLSFLFYNNNTNQFGGATARASVQTDPRLGANLSYSSSLVPAAPPISEPYIPYVSGGVPYGLAAEEEGFVLDPALKDPYSIALNFGVQQEIPGHMILKVNYVGRMGRRLLADADAAQVLNFPDTMSGQSLSPAFAALTGQMRANAASGGTTYTAIPWFEDLVGSQLGGIPAGYTNYTSYVASQIGTYGLYGDIGDAIAYMYALGLLPANVGMPAQFGAQAYLTNKGSSNYNALLFTLNRNLSQGLKFDFNYTLSHSIDNNSQAGSNNALYNVTGILCDVTKPRACRASSDFDVRQEITSDFTYDLPFGRGKMFLDNSSHLTDELIGGWSLSGLPAYRTGTSVNPLSDAFLASAASEAPAIFMGNKSDLKVHVNKVNSTGTVYGFSGGATGANKVFNEFRGPLGLEYGQRNLFKGPGAFNLDLGLAKIFPIIPSRKVNLIFRADAFNLLNHPNFTNPNVNIVGNARNFGQITSTINYAGVLGDYRVGQFSLRLEF